MGFWAVDKARGKREREFVGKTISFDLLHQRQCEVCPLNNQYGLKHPHMKPFGATKPLIYMIGEAPGKVEDELGRPFVGAAGTLLRQYIPREFNDDVLRWSNCVRTRPPKNRTPTQIEVECCRPSVEADIQASKPPVIFGFGGIPLHWALKQSGITLWRGRYFPVRIGSHVCWYFALYHPSYINRMKDTRQGTELLSIFKRDVKQAFDLFDQLPEPVVHTKAEVIADIEIITGSGGQDSLNRIEAFLHQIDEPKLIVGLDYETHATHPPNPDGKSNCARPYANDAKILSVALSSKYGTIAVALDHPGHEWNTRQRAKLDELYRQFLYKARCTKVAHNLHFEQEWSGFFYGPECIRAGKWGDSQSQAYLLDERPGGMSLEFLSLLYFGVNIKAISSLDRTRLAKPGILNQVLLYNGVDAKYHRHVFSKQATRLEEDGLAKLYKVHVRRVPTMVLTQLKGIPIDQKANAEFARKYSEELDSIAHRIANLKTVKRFKREFGYDFNPGSVKDVGKAIRELLGEEIDATREEDLAKLNHLLPKLILEYRHANKLLSTYILPFSKGSTLLYPDGKIHPQIQINNTRTSRTSSRDPNQQNWTKRKASDIEIRKQVKGKGDIKVVSFDYGQIQARNIAMESLDKKLIKYFWDRHDIHGEWMERIARKYPRWIEEGVKQLAHDDKLKKKYRHLAKNKFVFPSMFGAQATSISGYLGGIPVKICQSFLDEIYAEMPDVPVWHNKVKRFYQKYGYIQGLSGYRRHAPISPNQIINSPIQADETIIVCNAMSRLSELGEWRFQAEMEIHDDLAFLWPKADIEKNAEVVIEHMLSVPYKWAHVVPIVVEMSVGDDWSCCKEVGQYASDTWQGRLDIQPVKEDPLTGTWDEGDSWDTRDGEGYAY